MPSFVEDPTQFSKERLRAELVARSAPLPSSEARKQVYVELYRRHVGGSRSADFSSDEEEEEDARQDGEVKQNIDTEGMDVSQLTDKELKDGLLQYGVQIGPIVATTRALYEKKLLKLQSLPSEPTENNKQYSDSEEEISGPGSEEMGGDTVANIECRQQQEPGAKEGSGAEDCYYHPQCFAPSSGMHMKYKALAVRSSASPMQNCSQLESTVQKSRALPSPLTPLQGSAKLSQPLPASNEKLEKSPEENIADSSSTPLQHFSIRQMMENRSRKSSAGQRESRKIFTGKSDQACKIKGSAEPTVVDKYTMTSGSPFCSSKTQDGKQHSKEPVDVLTEMFPGIKRTPTGISATCRKPIKGAAGRPVQFRYPDISTSPDSKGQQEVQRHMVPMWVRVLVFLCVVCLLGLIYGLMENPLENPFSSMLESFNHMAQETEEQPAAIAQHDQL